MFRILISIAVVFLSSLQALAYSEDPSRLIDKDALREAIYAGDMALVEEVIATAHAMYQADDATADDLRVIFQLFTTTNPAIITFTKQWLMEKPDSVYAHTAQAWINYTASWNIRGEEFAQHTYPPALREFRALQESTWDHASRAFEIAPDFVPASDALLKTATQTGRIRDGFDVIAIVMDESPNMGSLYRAISMTHPGWSSATWDTAAWLCSTYAPMIQWDLNEDPETNCLIDAAMSVHGRTHYDWGYAKLTEGVAPSLDFYRLWTSTSHQATRAEAEFARQYLNQPGRSDYHYARRFDENVAVRYRFEFISYEHLLREKETAWSLLQHDPYDPELIKVLLTHSSKWMRKEDGTPFLKTMPDLTKEQRSDLSQRLLISSPFEPEHWRDFLASVGQGLLPETFQEFDEYHTNKVVYSNHSPGSLSSYLFHKANAYIRLDMAEKGKLGPEWDAVVERKNWTNAIICPMVRTYRLRDLVCETSQSSECTSAPQFEDLYAQTLLQAERDGVCFPERTEPPQSLFFSPIPIGLDGFVPPSPG